VLETNTKRHPVELASTIQDFVSHSFASKVYIETSSTACRLVCGGGLPAVRGRMIIRACPWFGLAREIVGPKTESRAEPKN
jgi:hypothetical protein